MPMPPAQCWSPRERFSSPVCPLGPSLPSSLQRWGHLGEKMGCGNARPGWAPGTRGGGTRRGGGTHHGTRELSQPQQSKGKVDAIAGDGVILHCLVHGHPDPLLQGGCVQSSLPPQHLGWTPCPQEVALAVLGHNPRWERPRGACGADMMLWPMRLPWGHPHAMITSWGSPSRWMISPSPQ